jgi:hypothetical protein
MARIVLRVRESTGEIYVLERGASGNFEFGDPTYGKEKHHSSKHLVERTTIDDAIHAIGDGLHPRMKGIDSGQFNMISPAKVRILDVPE